MSFLQLQLTLHTHTHERSGYLAVCQRGLGHQKVEEKIMGLSFKFLPIPLCPFFFLNSDF